MRGPWTVAALIATLLVLGCISGSADEADAFFDDSKVQEIRIYFDDPSWYDNLYASHASDPDDPYFPARFVYQDLELDPVGVRFKGNSSFGIRGVKKSFKIDFNEYDEDNPEVETSFMGLKKLNLNNGFKDPTLIREKLFLDFCSDYVPVLRAVHTRVYVNDVYWGLYTAVEQIDMTFIRDRFGSDEDGNLYEGESSGESPRSAFGSDLSYLGSDPASYYGHYQLKTNQSEADWSDLVAFIDVLNNTPSEQLPEALEAVFDVEDWLANLALDMLFVNLDAYSGSAHNYYLYHRDDTDLLSYLHWDVNESFGSFRYGVAEGQDLRQLAVFWLPESGSGGQSLPRPLMSRVWAVDAYARTYLRLLARMLREGFDRDTLLARITVLADLIRDDVYADTNKPYSSSDFETGLVADLGMGQQVSYGLLPFVEQRAAYLDQVLDGYAEAADLRLNEVLAVNSGGLRDGAGDRDPWLELYNLGPGRVELDRIYLSDDPEQPKKWRLPEWSIDDGSYLVVWLDGETNQGVDHAFALQPGGGELCLSALRGGQSIKIDCVSYPALDADQVLARLGDGEGGWKLSDRATPNAANLPSTAPPAVFINELMAENDTTIADPDGNGGYPDWFELYNAGSTTVELGGMYLTDDLDDPYRWQIPAGVSIPARGYLLLWADNDEIQGPSHAGFKLDADGEAVALFQTDGDSVRLVDSVIFPALAADISFGRAGNGTSELIQFTHPTPGTSNSSSRPRRPSGRR